MSQRRPGDGPTGAGHGDDLPELGPEWAGLVVPEDTRDLDADVRALRRERRTARRRRAWSRLRGDRSRGRRSAIPHPAGSFSRARLGLAAPILTVALLIAILFGSLMLVLPDAPAAPRPAPLATPSAAAGELGGLVPAIALTDTTGARHSLRDLRPAVVMLAPRGCDCAGTEAAIIQLTQDTRVGVTLVSGDDAATVPRNASSVRVHAFADPHATVAKAMHVAADVPTAALVAADGTILQLRQLAGAGAVSALRDSVTVLGGR